MLELKCDSHCAINIADSQKFSHRTKHMDIRYHYIRGQVDPKDIKPSYHPTSTNIADMLTKPRLSKLRGMCGLN